MAPPVKTHCLRGHEYTEHNIIWSKLTKTNGRIVRKCRRCRARQDQLRYQRDPAYAASARHRAKNRYWEGKA